MKEYTAQPAEAGARLDVVVASRYPQYTRSSLELLFDKDFISVNGRKAKPSYKVREDDLVQVDETFLKQEPPESESAGDLRRQ